MVPPILHPPIQKKTPWGLIIGIILGVLLLAGVGIGVLIFAIVKSEKEIPMTAEVRSALFTVEDIEQWRGEKWPTNVQPTESLFQQLGKTRLAEYTVDADDLYIYCSLEYGGVGSFAIDSIDFNFAKRLAPEGTDGSLSYREDAGFFTWGDKSWYSHVLGEDGERVGFYFISLGPKRLFTLEVIGVAPETNEEMRRLLQATLDQAWMLPATF